MSRIARIVLEGVPYHVTQRGNGRQQVFFEDRDYKLYLDRPLGDELFVENLEKRCGRRLRAQPVGRPKGASTDEVNQLALG
jgi:hypothetical protein